MKRLLIVAAFAVGVVPALYANQLAPACGSNTLDFYLQAYNNNDCSVGILNFADFSFSASGTPGAVLLPASQFEVTPQTFEDNLSGGFLFNKVGGGAITVGAGQTATYLIDWFFVIDAGPVGMSADLGMDPPFGTVSADQSYCPDGSLRGRTFCSTGFQSLGVTTPPCVDPVGDPASCTAHINFSPQIANFAEVLTTITITGGSGGSGFDSIRSTVNVINTGTTTPEPATILLTVGGLLALALRRKADCIDPS